jgi:hypothetical protein
VLHLNGRGYAAESGEGRGMTGSDGVGRGGGFGGYGGGPGPQYGGIPYGSVFRPVHFGRYESCFLFHSIYYYRTQT